MSGADNRAPDPADIQALVDRGFASLSGARYLLLRIADAAAARSWLADLPLTTLAEARASRVARVCQAAFTADGLRKLGLDPHENGGFAPEFVDGMCGDERRSLRLGDEGDNAPRHWHWGVGDREPHVLIILLAHDSEIEAFEAELARSMPPGAFETIVVNRSNGMVVREPFGFVDGISQAEIDWDQLLEPGGARDRDYRNRTALGEFLLGYSNEYGLVADYPEEGGIGLNGTYLVYRQLAQDVSGFWQWLAGRAGSQGAVALAEQMVGRAIDGAPLPKLRERGSAAGARDRNDFDFSDDPDGIACAIGSHIRRANPRSGDDPQGRRGFLRDIISSLGLKGSAIHDAVASSRFHRILRRGRAYGPMLSPRDAMLAGAAEHSNEAGLHFICLNASFARQFEFVQASWLASPYFGGMSGEQDPLLGNRCPVAGGRRTDAFSYHDTGGTPRLLGGLPRFVTMKGGAYFFMPGIAGWRRILAR